MTIQRNRYSYHFVYLLFLIICGLIVSYSIEAQPATDSSKQYIIGIGDILSIQVWENEDLNRSVEISQDGSFTFPLIGKVNGAGLSIFDLEMLMKMQLSDGYLVAPQVTVSVKEYMSQKVFVFGEVKKPGTFVIRERTSILEIISMAGGLTENASQEIKIVRSKGNRRQAAPLSVEEAKENEIIRVDLQHLTSGITDTTAYTMNGDSIYVEEAPRLFVTGEVKKPGQYKWEKGMTVLQAISLAGGPSSKASLKRTKIIRTVKGVEKESKAGMNDPVSPNDIIKIPESFF